jgi:hypothetical protein
MTRYNVAKGYSFAGKKKIALLNVYVRSKRDMFTTRRNIMADYLLQLKTYGYTLVGRDEIAKAIKELSLPVDKEFSAEDIRNIKEKLAADLFVCGFVSEEAESLISDEMNINFHFKYYDGTTAAFVAEALYQYQGTKTVLEAAFVKEALGKMLKPLGIDAK